MCFDYGQKPLHGDLCPIICSAKTGVESVSCVRSQRAGGARGSKSIFTAKLRAGGGTTVMFKSFNLLGPLDQEILSWAQNEKNVASVPSPVSDPIARDTSLLLNFSNIHFSCILHLQLCFFRQPRLNRSDPLMHDNSYLLIRYYADRDIFPQLVGYCGQFYVTEHLHSALDSEVIDDSSTMESWAKRVHLAVELLQLIELIDQENLLMCQVTPSMFGLTASGKVKIMDLDLTLPKALVNSLTSSGKSCSSDYDCSFYDCKSTCSLEANKCIFPVINTNLQIVCEKIFLGWSMPGRLLVPGLLMSVHTPMSLASLLRQCAHYSHSQEIAAHIATRLSDTLAEIDNTLEQHRTP
uniref:PIP49_C domain-containing protein n=1 Tax=Rhodnius prolixus TaxID=13249 RepID=T1I8M9_RHOPR